MRNKIALPALLAAGLALMATAATADDLKGLYAGIGVGSTSVDIDGQLDDRDTSFKIFGGYSFNKFLALELSYLDGGAARESEDFLFPGTPPLSFSSRVKVENEIINLSVVGNLPLTESFSLFGKLGYANIDTDTTASFSVDGSSFTGSNSNQRKELSYGAGATYSFGKAFQLRAEYEGFNVGGSDLRAISLSGIFRF
jgi:OOP family OmpA-OmpF porin